MRASSALPSPCSEIGMEAGQQPWTIHLQAKARNFHFKFKATKYLPTCFRFSLFLKISSLLIRVTSDNKQTSRRKSWKSNITRVIDKFRSRSTKRKPSAAQTALKSSRIKLLKWVSRESITETDTKGIIIHCLSILLYILAQLRTFMGPKASKFLLVSILAVVGYPLLLRIKNHLSYDERTFASRYIRKAWNQAASNGFLHAIAQVVDIDLF